MKQTRWMMLAAVLSAFIWVAGCDNCNHCKDGHDHHNHSHGSCPLDEKAPAAEEATEAAAEEATPEVPAATEADAEDLPSTLPAATEEVPGSSEVKEGEEAKDLPSDLKLEEPAVESDATAGSSPADTNPTAYAPVELLSAQLVAFVENIEKSLASDEDYEDVQGRVIRDANTVAALALVLGLHDQPNDYKACASNVIAAAMELAKDADKATAEKNFAALQASLKTTDGKNLAWDVPVANLAQLMKQVPLLDGKVKSGLRRFKKTDEMAGLAVALAAIFQVSTANVAETQDPTKGDEWIAFCLESRDDAGALANALTAADKKASKTAYDKMAKSCDTCHAVFHQTAK
ncbi:MAG: hypothetical protein Q4D98_08595 [Planctomycetia bacterium]|nr:hypothetical protein [Planctomycetia bacterium]